jgi:hypothetical protein
MNFKYFRLILLASLIIITSSISYGFDNNKCENLNSINYEKYDKSIEQDLENYGFHFGKTFGWYYSLNQLTEKKCPMLLQNYSELSKNVIYYNMLKKFPTNKFVEKSGFKSCLLSHLYKKDAVEILSSHINTLSKATDIILKHFEDSKKLTSQSLKKKFKLDKEPKMDLICKLYYIEMYNSKKGYGRFGKEIQKIENEAITEIKKINNRISNYCLDNDCEFD